MKSTPAKELWQLCRQIVKKRDGPTCYTCGKENLSGADWHIGHFIPKSICSTELAYDPLNLASQCSSCNIWKSGNWLAFEVHLILDHGQKYVDKLKKRNRDTKGKSFGTHWIKNKIVEYQALLDAESAVS